MRHRQKAAQGREGENAALSQHACNLGKHGCRVPDPGQQQVRENNVDTLCGDWQGSRASLNERRLREPGPLFATTQQHTVCDIDRNNMYATEALLQHLVRATGRRPKIDDGVSFDDERLQSRQQPFTRYGMDEIGIVEACCRAVEAATNMSVVQHRQTLSRFHRLMPQFETGP